MRFEVIGVPQCQQCAHWTAAPVVPHHPFSQFPVGVWTGAATLATSAVVWTGAATPTTPAGVWTGAATPATPAGVAGAAPTGTIGTGTSSGVQREREREREEAGGRPPSADSDMGEVWQNRAYDICEQILGPAKFQKRLAKAAQVHQPKFGDKTRISINYSKAKKTVGTDASYIRRCNAVGAVGYAVVLRDVRIPENDFFKPGQRFRLRLRHSNIRCDDDASGCSREAALKFADQNEDGPLDLILFTGRTAPARSCKTFINIMKLKNPDEIKQACLRDPHFFFSLVDGLRRGPESFAELTYHSQIPYKFIPRDTKPRLVRFRLIPAEGATESGLLDDEEQERPWEALCRRALDMRSPQYLGAEFLKRIEGQPINYLLQVQVVGAEEEALWNPQEMWDEEKYPWIDLAKVKMTTALTSTALNRTYFNIVDKPTCLRFPQPGSVFDYRSYHQVCCQMYTKFEIKHMANSTWRTGVKAGHDCEHPKVSHIVTLCAGPVKDTRPRVDVFITLTGTQGRTTPRRLDNRYDGEGFVHSLETEHFEILTEPIGDLLAVTVAVRHRHLTDDWYLRYVALTEPDNSSVRHFPCHSIVLSKVTLRQGNVSLPQYECHEVLRQERLLEVRGRQQDYQFHRQEGLPSQIRGSAIKDIPVNEQLRAEKFTTVPWEVDHALGDILLSLTALKSSTHQMSLTSRQGSYDPTIQRKASLRATRPGYGRQASAPAVRNLLQRQSNPRARMRWNKLKLAISFIAKVRLPDGPKGEMCRAIQDDLDFGRGFLLGSNPGILQRCTVIPENFHVRDEDVRAFLDRGKTLTQEAQDGHIYLLDYRLLDGLPTFHQDADHRYLAAPLCLLYTRTVGDLTPIAIQLGQHPGPDTPVWTPKEKCPEDWLLAKLWVRCADFHHQLVVSHFFKCHLLLEPFAIATLRQLSTSHPVYKLLKPHFRYTIPMNTLMRTQILKKGGALDRWTSLGFEGCRNLMKRFFASFTFDELDLPHDLRMRGVDNPEKLPNFFYRDDGLRLWAAVETYCGRVLQFFYKDDGDVATDTEVAGWIRDIHDNGFPGLTEAQSRGLPAQITSVAELTALVTKVMFLATCYHSATHAEALDLYGFQPLVPAMMRMPPAQKRGHTNRDLIVRTLPDQSPEAYYGSLATVLQQCTPDGNPLGDNIETYFVEEEARKIHEDFRSTLTKLTRAIAARNSATGLPYDHLSPRMIPNSAEPVPFLPKNMTDDVGSMPQFDKGALPNMFAMGPSVPLMTLPLCMQFARNIGGKSFIGRRLSVNMFSRAMGGVAMDKVNVPMNAIDRRMNNRNQMNMNMYYDGLY